MGVQTILILTLLVIASTWVFLHLNDRRRLINGFMFVASIIVAIILLIFISMRDNNKALLMISYMLIGVILLAVPLFFISMLITLITTGLTLIKREGVRLTNLLSVGMGVAIIIFSLFIPNIFLSTKNNVIRYIIIMITTFFSYFIIVFIIFFISTIIYHFWYIRKNKDYIIVLGAGLIKEDVTPLLASRIDKAIAFYFKQSVKYKSPKIIMSGGQGPDEVIAEARAMANYAISKGVPAKDIILEDKSTNTFENFLFSQQLIHQQMGDDYRAVFVTSNYHVFRSAKIAKKIGVKCNGIGANVKLYYYVSALIREYIAILYMDYGIHLITASIFSFIMITIYIIYQTIRLTI